MRRLRWIIVLLLVLTVYCGGYVYVRQQQWLVHCSGFAYGNTDNHRVDIGDMGIGELPFEVWASYWVFAPLRWMETAYWYLRYPKGHAWPYS